MENYAILGACHSASAYQSIQFEIEIGLMLSYNIVVYQRDNGVFILAIMPGVAMGMIENNTLGKIALDIETRLKTAIDSL